MIVDIQARANPRGGGWASVQTVTFPSTGYIREGPLSVGGNSSKSEYCAAQVATSIEVYCILNFGECVVCNVEKAANRQLLLYLYYAVVLPASFPD